MSSPHDVTFPISPWHFFRREYEKILHLYEAGDLGGVIAAARFLLEEEEEDGVMPRSWSIRVRIVFAASVADWDLEEEILNEADKSFRVLHASSVLPSGYLDPRLCAPEVVRRDLRELSDSLARARERHDEERACVSDLEATHRAARAERAK